MDVTRRDFVKASAIAAAMAAAGGSLALFGAQSFMVPAMVIILLALLLARRPLEQRYATPFSESEAAGDGGGRQGTAVERGVMR